MKKLITFFICFSLFINFSFANDKIWVAALDQSIACENNKAISLFEAEKDLKKMGIKIFAKRKIIDDTIKIQMCGIPKGNQNAFLILKSDLEKAKALGYEVANLSEVNQKQKQKTKSK
jgi:hypothetical protein